VPQIVPAEMLEAELVDDVVPVRGVTQYRRADPAAAWAGEQPGTRFLRGVPAPADHLPELDDDRHGPGTLALGALVDQPTGAGRGLPPYRP
jgi:hypothetical protein